MRSAARCTYPAAGMVLAACVLLGNAIDAPQLRPSNFDGALVKLVSAEDPLLNVPENLLIDLINIPYNELNAVDEFALGEGSAGSYYLDTPTNVFGWDPGNPPEAESFVNIFLPFPALTGDGGVPALGPDGSIETVGSGTFPTLVIPPGGETSGPEGLLPITAADSYLGGSAPPGTLDYDLNLLAAAELPEHLNCGFTCNDVVGTLQDSLQVPFSELEKGYQFGDVVNINDPGYPIPWSDQLAAPLNPLTPFENFFDSLLASPSQNPVEIPTLQDILTTVNNINNATAIAFAQTLSTNSYTFTGAGQVYGFEGFVNGLVTGLCPTCAPPVPDSFTETLGPILNDVVGPQTSLANGLVTITNELLDVRNEIFGPFVNPTVFNTEFFPQLVFAPTPGLGSPGFTIPPVVIGPGSTGDASGLLSADAPLADLSGSAGSTIAEGLGGLLSNTTAELGSLLGPELATNLSAAFSDPMQFFTF